MYTVTTPKCTVHTPEFHRMNDVESFISKLSLIAQLDT